MSRVHYEYMPSDNDCGYCSHFRMNDSKGIKGYCTEHRGYYPINDKCRKQQYVRRDERDIEKFLKWWVSSMIGVLLNKDITDKPFTSIKTVIEYAKSQENLQDYVRLYNIYGPWISECLRFDLDKNFIESLVPVLNKVSYLTDKGMMNEAFMEYYNLVMLLYKRYLYTLNYNSNTNTIIIKK